MTEILWVFKRKTPVSGLESETGVSGDSRSTSSAFRMAFPKPDGDRYYTLPDIGELTRPARFCPLPRCGFRVDQELIRDKRRTDDDAAG